MRKSASLILLPALAGCISFHTVRDGIARGRIGETVQVGAVAVTPTRVIEDSRCPAGVQCIWAGQVRIAVTLGDGAAAELTQGEAAAVTGGTVTLVEVYPERRKDWTIYPDEYRFGFRWEAAAKVAIPPPA